MIDRMDLTALPARDPDGRLHVVVESPRGSRVKLKYSPTLGTFVVSRPLVLGLEYPYDWGFVPSTRAADGDPVDAVVLLDAATYPGVVLSCRALALLELEQNAADGSGRQRNDRIVAEPVGARRASAAVSGPVRDELEAFFVSATLFTGKDVRVLGWRDAAAADAFIERSLRLERNRDRA